MTVLRHSEYKNEHSLTTWNHTIVNLEFECNKFYVKEGMDQDLFLEGVPGEQFFVSDHH